MLNGFLFETVDIFFSEMATQRKQMIDVLVDDKRKRLRGVTKYTTCDDVIKMVIKKTVQSPAEAPVFAVFESFNGKERQLSRKDRILKVLRSWGSDSENIGISVRRVDDAKSKMGMIKDKKKRLSRPRTKAFYDMSGGKATFTSTVCSLDFANSSDVSKQCLTTSADTNYSVNHKKKFTGITRKFETDSKQSVFRKIFTNVLKRKKINKEELKRKVKLQKSILTSDYGVTVDKKDFTYIDLQQSFKSHLDFIDGHRLGKSSKIAELDTAFVDDSDPLDVETADVSVLNTCIVEDPTECDNVSDSLEDDSCYKTENGLMVHRSSGTEAEQTFVKLDRIKKLFESNTTQHRTEDDFMDSFMRSNLYESESDTEC